ncbi:MAG: PsbP-related protein, partial [Anaerolineae bacterium]
MAKDTPKYSGIRFYRDPGGRFQLRYPAGWHQYDLAEERDGVMFSPQAQDPATWFAIWSTPLEHAVVA